MRKLNFFNFNARPLYSSRVRDFGLIVQVSFLTTFFPFSSTQLLETILNDFDVKLIAYNVPAVAARAGE